MLGVRDSSLSSDHGERMARARVSLEGLSVGDAFGQWFFAPQAGMFLRHREMPPRPWAYTDDTVMAMSVVEVLGRCGCIDQAALAEGFARRYTLEPHRGYGRGAREILRAIADGAPWEEMSRGAFGGHGSMGNGGAMRAGPIGGYFADDLAAAAEQGRLSAEVTHAHPEGQAGAMAVAVAGARAHQVRGDGDAGRGRTILEAAFDYTPEGGTRDGLVRAMELGLDVTVHESARVLGNGSRVVSEDTVPFAVWSAAKYLDDYEEAMWATVSAGGDMDTTCAIGGSIVVMSTGVEGISEMWRRSREGLDVSWREDG